VLVLAGLVLSVYSPSAEAATRSDAAASCAAYLPTLANAGYPTERCEDRGLQANGSGLYVAVACQASGACHDAAGFPYTWSAPANPCVTAWPATTLNVAGKTTAGSSTCSGSVPDGGGSGGTVQCALSINPESPPTVDPQTGAWSTWVTVGASGNTCSGSNSVKDGNGDTLNPTPFIPTVAPTTVTPPPALCTGGACYDPKADQFCATSGGVQFCVPGATARTTAGGCASGGSGTMCAGVPNAPGAPPDKVPDPATEIKTSDKITQADKTTGAAIPVNVVVWATQGTPTNGAKAGDSAPAPASTAPTPADGKSYGGGTDCQTPPACTGDVVMCGASRTQWATTCQLHKDLAGTTPAPSLTAGAHTSADVWSDGTNTGDAVADAANAGNYDASGMGFASTCPLTDMVVPLPGGRSFPIKFSAGCELGGWLRAIIIAFALFAAAKITAGGVG
jgi:hypothetical protein